MQFNHNVKPYSLTQTIDEDQEIYTEDTLPVTFRGTQKYLMVIVTDHSMFDHFYKEDLLNIRLQNTCSNGQESLVLLEDGSVILACPTFKDDQIVLSFYNQECYETIVCSADCVSILGVVCGAVRIN